jgi:hypothetical protein
VNLATGSPDEVVSFRAARFDRAAGATIHTFNLRDELDHAKTSRNLARLAGLTSLISSVELEAQWQEVNLAIDALLRREITGKAVLHVTQEHTSARDRDA